MMNKTQNEELLSALADKAHIQKIPTEKTRDLENIVFDALNSTVGGIVITHILAHIVCFMSPL